jgi:heme-degrading monooxygenase HmoA
MSEFIQDRLLHKYAYVAVGEFKSGCFGEAQQLYEKAVSTYKDGFQGAFLLQKPGTTDEGIAVILWDSIEAMDKANSNESHQAILEKMNPLFAKPPTTDVYEVCSEIGISETAPKAA